MHPINAADFTANLQQGGFGEIATKSMPAGCHVDEHSHPFEVRALVTDGDIALTVAGVKTRYGTGEVFTMAADCPHVEDVGPRGVTFLVSRKRV